MTNSLSINILNLMFDYVQYTIGFLYSFYYQCNKLLLSGLLCSVSIEMVNQSSLYEIEVSQY